MKGVSAAFVCLLLLASSQAQALDVNNYRKFKEKAESSPDRSERDLYRMVLDSYFQGISEVYVIQRDMDTGKVNVREPFSFCPPKGVKITLDLIRTATDSEIKENADTHAKVSKNWEAMNVAIFTTIGMSRMFPCSSSAAPGSR